MEIFFGVIGYWLKLCELFDFNKVCFLFDGLLIFLGGVGGRMGKYWLCGGDLVVWFFFLFLLFCVWFLFLLCIFVDGFRIVYFGEFLLLFFEILLVILFVLVFLWIVFGVFILGIMTLFDEGWEVFLGLGFFNIEYIGFLVIVELLLFTSCFGGLGGVWFRLLLGIVCFWNLGIFVIIFIEL